MLTNTFVYDIMSFGKSINIPGLLLLAMVRLK